MWNDKKYLNPFAPNELFLYHLKTWENCKIFWCFWGVEKEYIGNNWVKKESNRLGSERY